MLLLVRAVRRSFLSDKQGYQVLLHLLNSHLVVTQFLPTLLFFLVTYMRRPLSAVSYEGDDTEFSGILRIVLVPWFFDLVGVFGDVIR